MDKMSMEELGFFLYMEEMERQQQEAQAAQEEAENGEGGQESASEAVLCKGWFSNRYYRIAARRSFCGKMKETLRLSERSYIRLVAANHFITGGQRNEVLF